MARGERHAREMAAQRGRCLRAEVSALLSNELVIGDAGISKAKSHAPLFELRRRRDTNSGWIDIENALLGRPMRPGRGIPDFLRTRFKRNLKWASEAGRSGMALRSRKLGPPKRRLLCGGPHDAPVSRISRKGAGGRSYCLNFFEGITRVHAVRVIKAILDKMAEEVRMVLYDDASLRRLEHHLDRWETAEKSRKR